MPVGYGQIHCRWTGSGPLLLVLPAGNGPEPILPLLAQLAERFTILLVDLPGYGLSDPLPAAVPTMRDYAEAIAALLTTLGVRRRGLLGSHTGASIAAELAVVRPATFPAIVIHEGTFTPPEHRRDLLQHYMPPYRPDWHGGYLVGFWQRYREQFLFRPWHRHDKANRIAMDGDDAMAVHHAFFAQAAIGDAYRKCYEAVLRHDAAEPVERATMPIYITSPSEVYLAGARALRHPTVELTAFDRIADRYGPILAAADLDTGAPAALTAAPSTGGRRVLLPDLPGNGDSFGPPTRPTVASWARTAERLLGGRAAIVIGCGTGAVVAGELARRGRAKGLVLVNPPAREPVWDGTHLVRLWQALRSEALFWPWFANRRRPRAWCRRTAIRRFSTVG
ncbi:MAG: alpha/beta hydrolase [Alphaproteobacteria bacterium]|nr:alpha/beta hydrolase [Alphaproteobacteria bacterium]